MRQSIALSAVVLALIACSKAPAPVPTTPPEPVTVAPTQPPTPPQLPAAAPVAVAVPDLSRVAVLIDAPWGSGPAQLGHERAQEGNAEGPMAVDVLADGRAVVLDQVNSRVLILAPGQLPRAVPIQRRTVQDVAATRDGLVFLERIPGGVLEEIDADGKMMRTKDLRAAGLDPAGLTALGSGSRGLWLEIEHGEVVLMDGNVRLPGRPWRDGWMKAAKSGERTVAVTLSADGKATETMIVAFDHPVFAIRGLDADLVGRVFLVVRLWQADARDPDTATVEQTVAVVLGPDGKELARKTLSEGPEAPDETFQPVAVGQNGALVVLHATDKAATVTQYGP
jgi:hypothetical protein